jgi:hypothetical protein
MMATVSQISAVRNWGNAIDASNASNRIVVTNSIAMTY